MFLLSPCDHVFLLSPCINAMFLLSPCNNVSAATLSQICWPQPLSCSPYWMWPRNYPQRKITSLYQQNIADYLIQRHSSHAMDELRPSISWGCQSQKYCLTGQIFWNRKRLVRWELMDIIEVAGGKLNIYFSPSVLWVEVVKNENDTKDFFTKDDVIAQTGQTDGRAVECGVMEPEYSGNG